MAGGAKAKAAIVRKQPPPPKSVGTLDGKVVEGSEYANMLAADNNKYAASKAEGFKNGRVVIDGDVDRNGDEDEDRDEDKDRDSDGDGDRDRDRIIILG